LKHLAAIAALITSFFLCFLSCKKTQDLCSGVIISLDATTVKASTPSSSDGSISATATGSSDLTFSLNSGAYQSSGNFTNLKAGSYNIIAKNGNGCTSSKSFTVDVSKAYFLTLNTWKFSSAQVGNTDVSALIQTCQKDNLVTFSANFTGVLDEGATKCNPGDPQSDPFTWGLANNETILHVSIVLFTGGNSVFTIVALTDAQLVLSQAITVSGTLQTAVVTFIH
jgi:lipocalin-like protein